ncbi:MAG: hypothetical protein R3F43_08270 [bacterium]
MRGWMLGLGALALLAGWGDTDDDKGAPAPVPEATGPTFHADIKPLVNAQCVSCHHEGGAAPFALETAEQVAAMAPAALASIEAGRMPPWQPDPACRHYRRERILTAEQKATFKAWVEAGSPAGEPTQAEEQAQVIDFVADISTSPAEPYVADTERPDDYRCFALDADFAEDTFLAGAQVVPGDKAVVHHVLVYLVPPEKLAALDALDAEDEGPGYTCYGGTGLGNTGPIVGWVPGMQPNFYEEGIARYGPAGSRMVMQIHYNTLAAAPAPDLTTVQFQTYDGPQPYVIDTKPQANLAIEIPAGDSQSEQVREFTNRGTEPLEVVGVAPHMHVLGQRIKVEVIRADGGEECLIDIPDWDFNWQQSYEFLDGERVVIAPGDKFRLTCLYDNSAANQPVVNGEQLEPRDVEWGEGTLDEMCLNFVTVVKAFEAPTGNAFETCRASCAGDSAFGCVANCMAASPDSGECVLPALRRWRL